MLVATVGAWAAVGMSMLGWLLALPPTLLFVTVLGLGRAASAADRRTNARWAAQRRAAMRAAASERALAAGGPQTPLNHVVMGERTETVEQQEERVVGGPTGFMTSRHVNRGRTVVPTRTGAIEPVFGKPAPLSSVGAGAVSVVALDGTADVPIVPEVEAQDTPAITAEKPIEIADDPVVEAPAAITPVYTSPQSRQAWAPRPVPLPENKDVSIPGSPWDARPLPLPTYVGKDAAPQREHPPISAMLKAATDLDTPAVVSDESGAQPRSENLGIPLERILARRRAS